MRWLSPLAVVAFGAVAGVLLMAFLYPPTAQCDAGCETQRIFYFHVPSAYAMYIGVGTCVLGSLGYLTQRTRGWDALAQAGGELAVLFAAIVLTTGPIWGRKAWGHYWVWDPRLTTTLLGGLIFVAYLALRSSGGEVEKRFSAAVATLGAALIPIIHYSVVLWRGQHPTVITSSGGGLHPAMKTTLGVGFVAFTVLSAVVIAFRAHLGVLEARLESLEVALDGGSDDGDGDNDGDGDGIRVPEAEL